MSKLFERAGQLVKKYGQADAMAGFKSWTEEPAVQLAAIATQELAVL